MSVSNGINSALDLTQEAICDLLEKSLRNRYQKALQGSNTHASDLYSKDLKQAEAFTREFAICLVGRLDH